MTDVRLVAASLCLLVLSAPAWSQADVEDLWRQSQGALLPRLNTALETSPSFVANDWGPVEGLSGAITVFPAEGGSRPCRRFRVTVFSASAGLAGSGVRCRDGTGLWMTTDGTDHLQPLDPTEFELQQDLRRLAYYDGPVDGSPSASFQEALASFAADEEVADEGATPVMRERAEAAIGRMSAPGRCPDGAGIAGAVVACGVAR